MSVIQLYELTAKEDDRRFSPYCWRTRMALAHKGLEVEGIPWRFVEKEKIAMSGQGTVPVLIDKGKVVFDSWTIAEYLEDTYPDRPSLFGGPAGRALSRFYNNWGLATVNMGLFSLIGADIVGHLTETDQAYFRKTREARVGMTLEAFCANRDKDVVTFRKNLQPMRTTLESQAFLGGDKPLYADYIIFGPFQWARCISPFQLLEPSDPIYHWRQRLLDAFGGMAGKAKGYPV